MAAQDSGTHAEPAATAGPGTRLRARRESLGWSVEQVAEKLHLDARYIRALEQDRHADIAAPVFVRGYLRSYALMLQLPADAIVERYTAAEDDTTTVFDGPAQFLGSAAVSPALSRWLMLLVVVAGVAGVAAYVWRAPWIFVANSPEPVASPAAVSVSLSPQQPTAVAPELELDAAFTSGQMLRQEMIPSLPTDTALASPPLAAGISQSKLVLHFNADSWVMVSDATGQDLLYELVPGGSSRALEGARPPLQVVLGNSPAVTVEYNGKYFDQSRYSRSRVARFTLGGTAAP